MARTSNGKQGTQAEINVTPLIDVLLVLLIIFMVIEPSSVRGLKALLPKTSSTAHPSETNDSPIILQVSNDTNRGVTYKLNQASLSAPDLVPSLSRIFAHRAYKTMFIQGDAGLNFAAIAEVINSGHLAGADSIGIITTKPSSSP